MANELSTKSGLTFRKGLKSISRLRNYTVTIDGSIYSAGVLTCTTNAQLVPIDLEGGTARHIWLCNNSTTTGEKIDVHNSAASEDAYGFTSPIMTLYPGDVAQFPPGDGSTVWFAVSHTGTPELEFMAVET